MTVRRLALLLALTPGVGGRTLRKVLARMETRGLTPKEFLALSPEALIESFGLQKRAAHMIAAAAKEWEEQAMGLELELEKFEVQFVTLLDAHYPARLEAFDDDPPAGLFAYGNLRLLDRRTFSVLSSRNTSPSGLETIEKLVEEGVFASEVLVAGHDRPEYQRAAVVPLRWGSPRILCLDRGIFRALGEDLSQEPFRAARLWRYKFDPKTDLALSPFRPKDGPIGDNCRRRDRLVAALSDRIDFVEVAESGNMEKLARTAIKVGRQVRVTDRAVVCPRLREAGAEVLGV